MHSPWSSVSSVIIEELDLSLMQAKIPEWLWHLWPSIKDEPLHDDPPWVYLEAVLSSKICPPQKATHFEKQNIWPLFKSKFSMIHAVDTHIPDGHHGQMKLKNSASALCRVMAWSYHLDLHTNYIQIRVVHFWKTSYFQHKKQLIHVIKTQNSASSICKDSIISWEWKIGGTLLSINWKVAELLWKLQHGHEVLQLMSWKTWFAGTDNLVPRIKSPTPQVLLLWSCGGKRPSTASDLLPSFSTSSSLVQWSSSKSKVISSTTLKAMVNSVGIGHWDRFLENNWCTILRSM